MMIRGATYIQTDFSCQATPNISPSWSCHAMETFPYYWPLCRSPVDSLQKGPAIQNVDVFFAVSPNKLLMYFQLDSVTFFISKCQISCLDGNEWKDNVRENCVHFLIAMTSTRCCTTRGEPLKLVLPYRIFADGNSILQNMVRSM